MTATVKITIGGTEKEYPFFSPTFSSAPLTPDFKSDADWLLPMVRLMWEADNRTFKFDAWQEELIRRVLELYPEGHPRAGQLRYRQVIISMGRQNGKTEIGTVFGIYGLLVNPKCYIVGLGYTAQTAQLIYDRTMSIIKSNRSLSRRMNKLTETRGIHLKSGGRYEIRASKSSALQGIPVSLGLVDELHIIKPKLWTDLVNGTGGRAGAIIIGITTAGDEDSKELMRLYELAKSSAAGDPKFERIGGFIWEAEEAEVPDDDEVLADYLIQANPSYLAGRVDLEAVLSDIRSMPEPEAIRYKLNRFINSVNSFIPITTWLACHSDEAFPKGEKPFIAIDRKPDHGHASIVASVKVDGKIYTRMIASLNDASDEAILQVCIQLKKRHKIAAFLMDSYSLKDLGRSLKDRGLEVKMMTLGDIMNSSALFYQKVKKQELAHNSNDLLTMQIPRAVRKEVQGKFRISRKDSQDIDAVMATVIGVYGAETIKVQRGGVF